MHNFYTVHKPHGEYISYKEYVLSIVKVGIEEDYEKKEDWEKEYEKAEKKKKELFCDLIK